MSPREHFRVGLGQILLDGQRRTEAAVSGVADLKDLAAEQEAVAADRLAQVVGADRDPLRGVVEQQAVQLARSRRSGCRRGSHHGSHRGE
jgi:hypothetical protein